GGQQLRRLHQRPLQPAQRRLQFGGVLVAVECEAEIALAGQARRETADRGADPGVAAEPPAQPVPLISHQSFSSSSTKPEITPRPLSQKAGSEASSPNGASSSLCRFTPPARSMSRYFAWKPSGLAW